MAKELSSWWIRNEGRLRQKNWWQKQPWGEEERMDKFAEAALTMSTLIAELWETYFPELGQSEFADEMHRLFEEMCKGNLPDHDLRTAEIKELVILFRAEALVVADPGG